MSTVGSSEIYEVGLHPFSGVRLGVLNAQSVVARSSIRRLFGIGRPVRYKVLPALLALSCLAPAVTRVFADLVVQGGTPEPSVAEVFAAAQVPLLLFAALFGCDLLPYDRRTRKINLYLASPLTASRYVVAKAAALTLVLGVMATIPPALVVIVGALGGGGRGPGGIGMAVLQLLASAAVLALTYSLVSLACSSFSQRSSVAALNALVVFLGGTAVVAGLTETDGEVPGLVQLLDVANLPIEVARRFHSTGRSGGWSLVSDLQLGSAITLLALAAGVCVWSGHRSTQVGR